MLDSVKQFFRNLISPVSKKLDNKKRSTKKAYTAASFNGSNYNPQDFSGDAAILSCQDDIRAKTRDLARNNPYVAGVIQKNTIAIVGSDLQPQFQFVTENGELNESLNTLLELRFNAWKQSAMLDGSSFTDLATIVANTLMQDGEILQYHTTKKVSPGSNPLRIQLFENDYLVKTQYQTRQGIKFNNYGAPESFFLYECNPNDSIDDLSFIQHYNRSAVREISADYMRLIRFRSRSSQYRGISPIATIAAQIHAVNEMLNAELACIRASQIFSVLVKSNNPTDLADGLLTESQTEDTERVEHDFLGAPGSFLYLNNSETVEQVKNDRPNSNFKAFNEMMFRGASSGLNVPYSSLSSDLSTGSYSSLRIGHLEHSASVKVQQTSIEKQSLRPIVQDWLKYEVLFVGVPGLSYQDLVKKPETLERFKIPFKSKAWIDPAKALTALQKEIDLGLKTRSEAAAEIYGSDWDSNIKKLAEEKQKMENLGIISKSPARANASRMLDSIELEELAEIIIEKMNEQKTGV